MTAQKRASSGDFQNVSVKTLSILQNALGSLQGKPLRIDNSGKDFDYEVYLYKTQEGIVEKMAERGYKFTENPDITEKYNEWKFRNLISATGEKSRSDIERNIRDTLEMVECAICDRDSIERIDRSDSCDWSDVSNTSTQSNASTNRAGSIVRMKDKMKQSMRDSSARRQARLAQTATGLSPRSKKPKVNGSSAEPSDERRARSREPKSASGKTPSTTRAPSQQGIRAPSSDRAEFARMQNQKVQKLKEKKSQLEKSDSANSKSATNNAQTTYCVSSQAPLLVPKKEKIPAIKQNLKKHGVAPKTLLKEVKREPAMTPEFNGDLPVNSTFIPGMPQTPAHFNATLNLDGSTVNLGPASNEPIFGDTTYSKAKVFPKIEKKSIFDDTVMNPNETYKNYGIDDLDSESDNTDDESQPRKPIPAWAIMSSDRFKGRVVKQLALGSNIEKYGAMDIIIPMTVDLDRIFERNLNLKRNLNTSSFVWDTTQTFIQN